MSTKIKSKMIYRLNRHCAYFPCHDGLQDCTFCYCPYYPCRDIRLGGYIRTRDHRKVWSCENCNWIHRKKVVDSIFNLIRNSDFRALSVGQRKLTTKKTGIIILGHGSKLKKSKNTLSRIVREIRKQRSLEIIPAYLQLCAPDLHTCVKKMVEKGCTRVIVVPFFLFEGNHVCRDIPQAIEQEAKIYKDIKFVYAKNIGYDPRISEIVLERIKKALLP